MKKRIPNPDFQMFRIEANGYFGAAMEIGFYITNSDIRYVVAPNAKSAIRKYIKNCTYFRQDGGRVTDARAYKANGRKVLARYERDNIMGKGKVV